MARREGHVLPATAAVGDMFYRWSDNKWFFCVVTDEWTDSPGFENLFTGGNSAGLRGALSDETGTGAAVFATSPTLVTPILGVATATSIVASLGLQTTATPRTATATGATTGTIADNTGFVVVTSDDANKIIILPTPTPGTVLFLYNPTTGYELRTTAPASIAINGGTGTAAESAIPADTLVMMICESATSWKGLQLSSTAGTLAKVEVAAP